LLFFCEECSVAIKHNYATAHNSTKLQANALK
jgi:hypothetical protein